MLWSLCAQAQSPLAPASAEATPSALQARITRVEQGLSTRVVVKGSPDQKMTLTERMAFYQVPGVSIALINHGRIEWVRAYGVADIASRRPATTTTLFQAASVSKAVSAMGALRLVEQGKLSLDGDANSQLVSWKIPQNEFTRDKAVSLRMLLNHSAGITVHGFKGYVPGQKLPTLLQVLDGTAPANSEPVRVDIAPGSTWRYSGGGYSIVQLMMSEASGQPFDQYMKAAVLDPLGMAQSTFAVPLPSIWHDLAATGYDGNGKAIAGQWHNYPESAAAGLWTTPSDLARVVIEVQQAESGKSDKILSRNMTSTMLTRGLGEYGLGFFVENLGDRTSFAHTGGTEGFRSQLYGYTRSGQGVVVMTNSDNGAALIDEILSSIAAEYGWPEFHVIKKTAIAGDANANKQLAGDYQLVNLPAHIVAEGERLYFQSELFGAKRMELFPESKTAFFMTAQDMSIRFERSDDGAIVGFKLVRGSNTYPATKTR
ncbi:serine hydrolase domain-containing protein [Dyella sp. OK004]|uniref:serine hydrolase domain-containing protein n=1 Tax=Dyella sp. OK004 TaxID=1855292 RepID=UPI002100D592|nr:serine hydrolase domain-containing protein [Dyella sp. OK004]